MNSPSGTAPFNVTIVLPAIDETWSLRETLIRIESTSASDVLQYLIVVSPKFTTQACREVAQALVAEFPGRVQVLEQRLPFLGGAVRDGFDAAKGTHVVMMASDLETDPNTVKDLIDNAAAHPSAIVTASRWRLSKGFQGYSKVKLVCNWLFQRFFAVLYGVRLSDMTFAFRIFPTKLVQSIRWEELRHAFLFETLVKPLRLGVQVIEVPSGWKARSEGKSQNTFLLNFIYFRTGLRTRFASRKSILKPGIQA